MAGCFDGWLLCWLATLLAGCFVRWLLCSLVALLAGCFAGWLLCWLLALRASHMLVYLSDGSAQTSLRAATLRYKIADQTFDLTQSQNADTGPTSPSADPITPGAWQGSSWRAIF